MPAYPGIDEYRRRVGTPSPILPNRVPRETIGEGIVALGHGIGAVSDAHERMKEQDAAVAANSDLMAARSHWMTQFQERKTAAPAGAENFTPQLLEDFDKDSADRLKRAKTPTARRELEQRLSAVRLGLQQDSMQFEAGERVRFRAEQLSQATDNAATATKANPYDFPEIAAAQKSAIEQSGLDAESKAKLWKQAQDKLSYASVLSMAEQQPVATLAELKKESSDVLAVKALPFEQKIRMIDFIENELRRKKAERDIAFGYRVQDAKARYMNGIDVPNPPTKADFAAAFERPEQASHEYADFADVQKLGGDLKALSTLPPQEQIKLLEARTPTASDATASSIKAQEILATRVAQLHHELETDPAAYALKYDRTVQASAINLAQAPGPETAQRFATASLAAQTSYGVSNPRILTQDQVGAIEERLKPTGNGAATYEAIQGEAALWGRYWPQVLAEAGKKVNPMVQVIALGMEPQPGARLGTLAKLKDEELKALLPAETKVTDIENDSRDQLQEFAASYLGNPGAEEQFSRLNEATKRLAISYISEGEKQGNAVERAANEVINARYEFTSYRGSALRVPKTVNADLVTTGLFSVSDKLLVDLGYSNSAIRWKTLPDDYGVYLEDRAAEAPLSKDGKIISFSFDELQQKGVNREELYRQSEAEMRKLHPGALQ